MNWNTYGRWIGQVPGWPRMKDKVLPSYLIRNYEFIKEDLGGRPWRWKQIFWNSCTLCTTTTFRYTGKHALLSGYRGQGFFSGRVGMIYYVVWYSKNRPLKIENNRLNWEV